MVSGMVTAEFVARPPCLVGAEVVGQSSIVMYNLAIVLLYFQSLTLREWRDVVGL